MLVVSWELCGNYGRRRCGCEGDVVVVVVLTVGDIVVHVDRAMLRLRYGR